MSEIEVGEEISVLTLAGEHKIRGLGLGVDHDRLDGVTKLMGSDELRALGIGHICELVFHDRPPEGLAAVLIEDVVAFQVANHIAVDNSVTNLGIAFAAGRGLAPGRGGHAAVLTVERDGDALLVTENVADIGVVDVELDAAEVVAELLSGPTGIKNGTDPARNRASDDLSVGRASGALQKRGKRDDVFGHGDLQVVIRQHCWA